MIFPMHSKLFKDPYVVWTYCILIIISTMAALLSVNNIVISADSMTYGLVSQQLIVGNGIKVPMVWFNSNSVPVGGTVPLLIHPPLFPISLAILGGVTSQNFLPAQILNVLCHVMISIFAFSLMKNLYDNKGIALLTGILVSITFPLLRVSHHLWSETFFILLTIAAVYYLTVSRRSDNYQHTRNLFLAGIFASASIMTKNSGIAILAVFFWEIIILIKNKKLTLNNKSTIIAMMIPIITPLILFIRNYAISGVIRGHAQPPIERSYLNAFNGTMEILFSQFHLGARAITLILIFSVCFILYIAVNADARRDFLKFFYSGLDLIIVFTISYTALIWLSMAKMQPRFEMRFMSPLAPFLMIMIIFMVVFLWKATKSKWLHKLSLYGMILSLGIIALGTGYKTYLNLHEFFHEQERGYSILHSCTYKWIRDNYGKDTIITTNKAYQISFFGGYSTVILPSKIWAQKTPIPENMESVLPDRMSEIGSSVLVLFKGVEERYFGRHLAGLFNKKEENSRLTLAHECPDGMAYVLKE